MRKKRSKKENNRFQFAVCKQLKVFTHSLTVNNWWCGRSYVIKFVSVDSWFRGAHSLPLHAIYNELLRRQLNAYLSVPAYLRSHWFVSVVVLIELNWIESNFICLKSKNELECFISPKNTLNAKDAIEPFAYPLRIKCKIR